MKGWRCNGTLWVCEVHSPWEGEDACGCGAAGMPCSVCNKADPLEMPLGFDVHDGERH